MSARESIKSLLLQLCGNRVDFILVGGVAAWVHGSVRATLDVDVVYRRTPENLKRLVETFDDLHPYPRGAPPGLPFKWDSRTLEGGLNFTLTTDLGPIDLLGEVAGAGTYDELLEHCRTEQLFGIELNCVDLETLIHLKRAAGRPKDFEAIAELQSIREELEKQD